MCAANCSISSSCQDASFPWQEESGGVLEEVGGQRLGDVIFCGECVARAELVYERFAWQDEVRKAQDALKPKVASESESY